MMSLQDYLNQKDLQRTGSGQVHLTPNEYSLYPSGVPRLNHVIVNIDGRYYSYVTKPLNYTNQGRVILYVSDEDGNPTFPSCFSIPNN